MHTDLLTIERDESRHAPLYGQMMDKHLSGSISNAVRRGLRSTKQLFDPDNRSQESIPDTYQKNYHDEEKDDRHHVAFFDSPVTVAEEPTPAYSRPARTPLYERARRNSVSTTKRASAAAAAAAADAEMDQGDDDDNLLFHRSERTSFLPPLTNTTTPKSGRHTSHSGVADILGSVRAKRKAFTEGVGAVNSDDVLQVHSATKFNRRSNSSLA